MTKLSIIIPVYNEEKTLKEIIDRVKRVKLSNITKEIIVVDDFSKDDTRNILSKIKGIKKVYHKKNMGKGAAIKTGLKNSTGDLVLIQDADLEYNPSDYPKLLKPIMQNKTKVVYGSRFEVIRKNLKYMYKLHYIGNLFLTFLTNLLYNTRITDMETGYKLLRKEVIDGITIKANGFDFEPEITAKLLKKGYKIIEVPIGFVGRHFDEGKKITWIDGIKAVYYLLKYRFSD
ncbi:glycosyl transferase [Candidatus Woesearchaeota archaeon]|jgi:glycosyltransferase involved in cell wall biosynthesis|nr:glycosyl transferase [Candidatus Woesearchaeota archaeon]|tara:strand:+ start:3298 stop:3990 length:693 start_codon:yes stop_codon:yes gene_type:complete